MHYYGEAKHTSVSFGVIFLPYAMLAVHQYILNDSIVSRRPNPTKLLK